MIHFFFFSFCYFCIIIITKSVSIWLWFDDFRVAIRMVFVIISLMFVNLHYFYDSFVIHSQRNDGPPFYRPMHPAQQQQQFYRPPATAADSSIFNSLSSGFNNIVSNIFGWNVVTLKCSPTPQALQTTHTHTKKEDNNTQIYTVNTIWCIQTLTD